MDIRTALASQAYASNRSAAAPKAGLDQTAAGPDQGLANAANRFSDILRSGEEAAMSGMLGGADPHALVQALAKTELAVETAVTVRDKVVEAYQEVLRMPV